MSVSFLIPGAGPILGGSQRRWEHSPRQLLRAGGSPTAGDCYSHSHFLCKVLAGGRLINELFVFVPFLSFRLLYNNYN